MRNLHSAFGTSRKKEVDGVVVEYPGAVRVTLARAGGMNEQFAKAHERNMRPFRHFKSADIPQNKARELVIATYVETVIRRFEMDMKSLEPNYDPSVPDYRGDWQPKLMLEDGSIRDATSENLKLLLLELPELLNQIIADASDIAMYRKDQLDQDAKNLPSS